MSNVNINVTQDQALFILSVLETYKEDLESMDETHTTEYHEVVEVVGILNKQIP